MMIITKISSWNQSMFCIDKSRQVNTGDKFVNTILNRDAELFNYIDNITDVKNITCCFKSSFSFVCLDNDRKFAFKIFNICNKNVTNVYFQERDNYKKLNRLGIFKKDFYHSSYENRNSKYFVITFNYIGEDALEMINKGKMTELAWIRNLSTMPTFIDKFHGYSIYHMDIKLENMCYNGEEWTMIDWGLSKFDKEPIHRIIGTLPYLHPIFATQKFNEYFRLVGFEVCDYYSYAVSLFSVYMNVITGCCEDCFSNKLPCEECYELGMDETPFVKFRICDIYKLIKADEVRKVTWLYEDKTIINKTFMLNIMKILGKIILSEIDRTKKYLIWGRKHDICYVENFKTDPQIESQITTCKDHWQELVQYVNN